ncbi:MAG TPA: cyanophycin synthetase [Verrucomicrobiae bacterium]|nr:cyanophycin synthetase [Verrucomicrobiae bacterium]
MKVVAQHFLRGPNLWSRKPCALTIVDLENLDEVATTAVPGFDERLLMLMPTLQEHGCSYGEPGGFVRRLAEGTYMAHVFEHVLIELQCLAGSRVSFGKARMIASRPRHYHVVCRYEHESVVEAATPIALELVQAVAAGKTFDLASRLEVLCGLVATSALGPSTRAIVEAAQERGIPWRRLGEASSLIQLGQGREQRRIQATITSQTGYIATDIASDKQLTKQLLADAAIPVPRGMTVMDEEQALAAYRTLAAPVTVKPLDANQGKGVTPYVASEDELRRAYRAARMFGTQVIVEHFVKGNDYRVLVIGGKVAAAARRYPPTVVGDGNKTILQLIEDENRNPLREEGHGAAMTKIPVDAHVEELLARKGMSLASVLPPDEPCLLRANANLSTGGEAEDMTGQIHPSLTRMCERAARKIGLDVAGVDLICEDIARPLGEQEAGIVEVNAAPGIRMHEDPAGGMPRRVGAAIVASLYPPGRDGRIPVIAVTGTNGKTTTTIAIAHVFKALGCHVGRATTESIEIGGHDVRAGDCSGYWSARCVLEDPDVEVAVLEVARGGILRRGLGFDLCDVAVVLNISADHLGQDDIDDVGQLSRVKAVVADSARRALVVNAMDSRALNILAEHRPGVRRWLFSRNADAAAVLTHVAAGGDAVVLSGGEMLHRRGTLEQAIATADEVPMTVGGLATFNVDNALATIAACLACGLDGIAVGKALAGFMPDSLTNPLRLNLFEAEGVKVVVDYAHNSASYQELFAFARRITPGKLVGVISAPGDRRGSDLEEVGQTCAALLDEMIVYEMRDRRGRLPGETAALIATGATACDVQTILHVHRAVRSAFERCVAGDTLVLGCASALDDLGDLRSELTALDPSCVRAASPPPSAGQFASPPVRRN